MREKEERFHVDVWGNRGSFSPVRLKASKFGNYTPCISILSGDKLIVLDAGTGICALGDAMLYEKSRFNNIKEIDLFISHPHKDHIEGLGGFWPLWQSNYGLKIRIYANKQVLEGLKKFYKQPFFVSLDKIAQDFKALIEYKEINDKDVVKLGSVSVKVRSLNHPVKTLGFRIEGPDGQVVSYLSDHQPTPEFRRNEDELTAGAHLEFWDSHFVTINEENYGHGSIERLFKRYSKKDRLIVAVHLNPALCDSEIEKAYKNLKQKYGKQNTIIAQKNNWFEWNRKKRVFELRKRTRFRENLQYLKRILINF